MRHSYALLLPLLLAGGTLHAQATEDAEQGMTAEQFEATLKYQTGTITLKDGLATLRLPAGYRYLDPDDSQRLLVDAWGNPPGEKTLGMILPAAVSPLTDEGWGVVITYQEDGYVKDDDAASIDYDALLKDMQEGTRENNVERQKAGYEPLELVGWAARPHYDAATHKMYWAQELKFGSSEEHTLNYDVRVLGRRGVLSLNAIGSMGQLPTIERDMQGVLGFVDFNDGHRYADFTPGADKVAAYGIGALIAGKVAVKAGLFKVLLAGLLAAKKLVAVVLVALAGFAARLFGRRKESPGPA